MADAMLLMAVAGGALVGFSLSLVGGGGSILAVPILVYLVGIKDPHLAIGTSAVGVAANALIGLVGKARAGLVKWHCGLVFAAAGVAGAAIGSIAGKAFDGQALLALFAGLMILVGVLMLRRGERHGDPHVALGRENAPKLVLFGFGTGLLSGFFGIGGGFLIVPGLIAATGMPIFNAMATSLLAVTSFGVTTATSYALSGLINWPIAGAFVGGGLIGAVGGGRLAAHLSTRRGALTRLFAALIFAVAAYMLWQSLPAIGLLTDHSVAGALGAPIDQMMPERILELAVAVAPELVGQFDHHARAGIDRAVPPGVGILDLQVQHHADRIGQVRTAMMFGKMVVHHQGRTIDLQMGMHQPAIVGGMAHQFLGAERLLVEVDGFGRLAAADRQMRGQPDFGFLEFKIGHSTHSLPSPSTTLIGARLSRSLEERTARPVRAAVAVR